MNPWCHGLLKVVLLTAEVTLLRCVSMSDTAVGLRFATVAPVATGAPPHGYAGLQAPKGFSWCGPTTTNLKLYTLLLSAANACDVAQLNVDERVAQCPVGNSSTCAWFLCNNFTSTETTTPHPCGPSPSDFSAYHCEKAPIFLVVLLFNTDSFLDLRWLQVIQTVTVVTYWAEPLP